MLKGGNTKETGLAILFMVLLFLCLFSIPGNGKPKSKSKPRTENVSGYRPDHQALVTGTSIFDREEIFTSVLKKYPERTRTIVKILVHNNLVSLKLAILKKHRTESPPALFSAFYHLYPYHVQHKKDDPALG